MTALNPAALEATISRAGRVLLRGQELIEDEREEISEIAERLGFAGKVWAPVELELEGE